MYMELTLVMSRLKESTVAERNRSECILVSRCTYLKALSPIFPRIQQYSTLSTSQADVAPGSSARVRIKIFLLPNLMV
jgi:hypothetical protein